MRSARRRTLCLIVLAILFVAAVAIGATRGVRAQQDWLFVPTDRLDFGEVWENTQFTWVLPIENRQNQDVAIQDVSASCICTSAEPKSLVVPAGQMREIRLTLDLSAARSKVADSEWRAFEVTVRPSFLEQGGKQRRSSGWKVRGRVHTAIGFNQPVLEFGSNSELSQPLSPHKLLIHSYVPVQAISARCTSPLAKVNVRRLSDNPRQFELVIAPAQLPVGIWEANVLVKPEVVGDSQPPEKPLLVTAHICSDFQASPPAVVFGGQKIGETAIETLNIHSVTNQLVDVVAVTPEGDGLTVEKPIDGNGRCFLLKQQITRSGRQEHRVLFKFRKLNGAEVDLSIPVSYLGVLPSSN